MFSIALIVMVSAVLIQHLGLSEAFTDVVAKIAKCQMCFTFWSVLAALLYAGCDFIITIALSIFMAYISNWMGLLLIVLQNLYAKVWQRINK